MSIIIKGMEMPKTCGECRFSVDGWCYAFASNDDQPGYIKSYEKAKWCPLIEVPPHGRLIDADAMEKLMSDTVQGDIRGYPYSDTQWDMAFRWIDHQPTVIPADKDGET